MQFTDETDSPDEYHLVKVTPTEDGCEVIGGGQTLVYHISLFLHTLLLSQFLTSSV